MERINLFLFLYFKQKAKYTKPPPIMLSTINDDNGHTTITCMHALYRHRSGSPSPDLLWPRACAVLLHGRFFSLCCIRVAEPPIQMMVTCVAKCLSLYHHLSWSTYVIYLQLFEFSFSSPAYTSCYTDLTRFCCRFLYFFFPQQFWTKKKSLIFKIFLSLSLFLLFFKQGNY